MDPNKLTKNILPVKIRHFIFAAIFSAITLIALPILLTPTGSDVQNAIIARSEIQNILKENGITQSGGSNVVLINEKKSAISVTIKNAQPSIDFVYAIIVRNKRKISKMPVTIDFKDSAMKKVASFDLLEH